MTPPHIRDIDPGSDAEISLVAQRMRDTLIEVEGRERGEQMYTLDWLEARLRWHLDPVTARGRVLVAVDATGKIVGHIIFRVEGSVASRYGLISTTYVVPDSRRSGIARRFLEEAERWFQQDGLDTCCTWTSSTNMPLIELYQRNGYAEVDSGPEDLTGTIMVKLAKSLERLSAA